MKVGVDHRDEILVPHNRNATEASQGSHLKREEQNLRLTTAVGEVNPISPVKILTLYLVTLDKNRQTLSEVGAGTTKDLPIAEAINLVIKILVENNAKLVPKKTVGFEEAVQEAIIFQVCEVDIACSIRDVGNVTHAEVSKVKLESVQVLLLNRGMSA